MATVDRRLWLDADGKLVEDGDPAAATLWHAEGDEVSDDDAKDVGYKPKSASKSGSKPDDKSASASENKGR